MTSPARERTPFNNPHVATFGRVSTADMAELLREGATKAEVAADYGMAWHSIRDRLVDGGWHSTGQLVAPPERPLRAVTATPDLSWQWRGECAGMDPEIWFSRASGQGSRDAKKICLRCSVRAQCLDYAISLGDPWGVWGGKTRNERRRAARRAAREEAP